MNYRIKHKLLFFIVFVLGCNMAAAQASTTFDKADKLYELGDYKQAIVSYVAALQQNPNASAAYGKLADCYRMTNDLNNASTWYVKAVNVTNPFAEHFFEYGLVLKMLGDYDLAKAYFTEYAKIEPSKGEAFAKSCDFAKARKGDAPIYQVEKDKVSSTAADYAPTMYKNRVIYASARTDLKNEMNDSDEGWKRGTLNQLLIATPNADGSLGKPQVLKKSFKSKRNEAPLSFSADGKIVAYTQNNFISGVRNVPKQSTTMRIMLAEVVADNEWKNDKPFPYNKPEAYNTGYPSLSSDGNTLYFASDMPNGFGGMDIYVSKKVNGEWGAPQNLGSAINTEGDEIAPFIDGNTLYFSSDFLLGFGGMDIFRAEQVSGSWSRVLHLGTGINSSADDYGLVFDTKTGIGYMTSNRGGIDDIYTVKTSSERIEIAVMDESGKPVAGAMLDFTACGQQAAVTDANGRFKFIALEGLDCKNIAVSKKGYTSRTINVVYGNKNMRLIEVKLTKIADVEGQYVGTVIDAKTAALVEGVRVRVKNMLNSKTTEAFTDKNGIYNLSLDLNTTYVLNYSKSGYTSTDRTIVTKDGKDKTILGTQKLEGSGAVAVAPRENLPAEYGMMEGEEAKGNATLNLANLPNVAYDVQFGVFSNPDKAVLNELKALGFVYYANKGEAKAYKVGAFKTRAEAEAVREKLIEKGYAGAFITTLTNKTHMARVLIDRSSTPAPPQKPSTNAPQKPNPNAPKLPKPATPTTSETGIVYKLQLGVYRNPKLFDETTVQGQGAVSYLNLPDGLTAILLGEYTSYEDAKDAEEQLKARGVVGVVVAIKNGVRVPVEPSKVLKPRCPPGTRC
jgi:tetratricopeptide (TPR) repeat protein